MMNVDDLNTRYINVTFSFEMLRPEIKNREIDTFTIGKLSFPVFTIIPFS